MMKIIIAALIVLAAVEAPPAVTQDAPPEIHVLNGQCDASNIDYGPSDRDTSVPQYASPLRCDEAIFTLYHDYPDHVQIDFARKGASGVVDGVAFGGRVSEDRRAMTVDHVDFEPGVPTPVADSVCLFYQNGGHFDSIMCGAAIESNGMRRAAMVNFIAAPGQ
jgi:hypothetical protein